MAKKLQILRGTTAQNDAYTGSIGELTMDTEKVEVRIHDGTTQGGKTIGSGGGASLPILTHVFSDHKLNDISWLNADTFSWQSGDVYEAAYNHLVDDLFQKGYSWQYQPAQGGQVGYTKSETPEVGQYLYTDGNKNLITEVGSGYLVVQNYKTGDSQRFERIDADIEKTNMFAEHETDTVDDITVTFYRAEDGHKICLADQEANVQRLYDWMGVAWYYVLDTVNKQFKLPRTKYAFTGLRDSVGGYVKAGLPNITGTFANNGHAAGATVSGAFTTTKDGKGSNAGSATDGGTYSFDASRSSSVYGNSNTVQPEATQMYLYFYVGNFERDAIEQTAGITSEQLNNKADTAYVNEQLATKANADLSNIPENYDYVIESQEPTSNNGYTWYKKFKSGWVIQGGKTGNFTNTTNGEYKTVTLPVIMKDSNYSVCVSRAGNNTLGNGSLTGYSFRIMIASQKSTTGFKIDQWCNSTATGTSVYAEWEASGYAE